MAIVAAIIPARYAATRLPGKPLLRETGKYLIQHVYETARACRAISRVVVATDEERIRDAVLSFGGEAMLTRSDHPNGTSRVAEAARALEADLVLNIQGDEPEIPAEHLEALVSTAQGADMATLATPFRDPADADQPARVKVVLDRGGYALYFSRARIPAGKGFRPLLHLGLYAYRKPILERLAGLPPSPLEEAERLEQLRALENGIRIRVGVVDGAAWGGVDTPEDYRSFVERWRGRES